MPLTTFARFATSPAPTPASGRHQFVPCVFLFLFVGFFDFFRFHMAMRSYTISLSLSDVSLSVMLRGANRAVASGRISCALRPHFLREQTVKPRSVPWGESRRAEAVPLRQPHLCGGTGGCREGSEGVGEAAWGVSL